MARSPASAETRAIATHRKAGFDLEIERTYEAGIVLCGSEVKSLRAGRVLLAGAHVRIVGSEAMVFGLTIHEYAYAHHFGHEALAPRKLLLHRHEIDRLARDLQQKGATALVSRIYWRGARVKLEIAVGTGKKVHDKRHALKAADAQREMARAKR
jgi:SsrA-binding protein